MKKLIYLLLTLTVLYFGIEISFIKLSRGHNVEYKLKDGDNTFKIKETYIKKRKNEINNYYFEIKHGDEIYNYQTYKELKGANYVIKKINYYEEDGYKCIYLETKNDEPLSDIICKKDGIEYLYNNMDEKFLNLEKTNYKKIDYKDKLENKIDADPVILYTDNLVEDHYISLQNYKGLYLINSKDKVKNIDIFKNDIYTNLNSITTNKYYITANYNKEYKFHEFYTVNIMNGKMSKIVSDDDISLDSYMQGAIDNEIYSFDKSEKKQYRINLKNKTVSVIGNTSKGIKIYEDNNYILGSAYDASKDKLLFNKYSSNKVFDGKEYARVDKVGNNLSGYYYLYLKDGKEYKVYRVNVQNKKIYTYLFNVQDIENIYYYKNYIYFKDGLYIKYYNDDIGVKTLLKNNEFEFNKTLKFGLYVD